MAGDTQRAIEDFAAALADLRNHAGKPSFARIQNLSKLRDTDSSAGRAISLPSTTASDAIRGKRLPSIATVLAFVDACRRAAVEDGMVVDAARFDLPLWQQRWRAVRDLRDANAETATTGPASTGVGGSAAEPVGDEEQVRAIPVAADVRPLITEHAQAYAHEVDAFRDEPHTRRQELEQRSLEKLHDMVSLVLECYDPPGARRIRNNLALADIYFEAGAVLDVASMSEQPDPHEPRPEVPAEYFAALLAAEVEFHGPVRLNYTEKSLLADLYERVGEWMLEYELFTHAAFAYKRAAIVHYQNEETTAQERCELASTRARRAALPVGLRNLGMLSADLLCGYGYLPFRMLGWILAQIILFTLLLVLPGEYSETGMVHAGIINFFSPLGLGDTSGYSGATRIVLVIESFAGTLSVLAFVVLLARRFLRAGRR
ncbi:hypothetical protein AB0H60_19405 [Nocardia rhamnosiphila]|uniref:hypothetical protein n=1 Tax=Nocardia rhamnosiphila TaxID=426716 RepID=UPI0033E93276